MLGVLRREKTLLQEALNADREALAAFDRVRHTTWWTAAQHQIGNALQALGESDRDVAQIRAAVEAFQLALGSRDGASAAWADTSYNLGNAWLALASVTNDIEALRLAENAYSAALEVLTADHTPLSWARTKNNRGMVRARLGAESASAEKMREALDDALDAWDVLERHGSRVSEQATEALRLLLPGVPIILAMTGQTPADLGPRGAVFRRFLQRVGAGSVPGP